MLSFKKWIQKENLAGPGGGPNFHPDSQESLARDNSSHGVGAFHSYGDLPPVSGKNFMNKKDNFKINYNKNIKKRKSQDVLNKLNPTNIMGVFCLKNN